MLGTAAGSGIHKEVRGILPKGLNDPRTPVRLGEVGLNAQGAASIHRKRPSNQDQRSRGQRTHTHRTETLLPARQNRARCQGTNRGSRPGDGRIILLNPPAGGKNSKRHCATSWSSCLDAAIRTIKRTTPIPQIRSMQ